MSTYDGMLGHSSPVLVAMIPVLGSEAMKDVGLGSVTSWGLLRRQFLQDVATMFGYYVVREDLS